MQTAPIKNTHLLAIAGLFFIAGCQSSDPFECYQAFENGNYEQAAIACSMAYEATNNLDYGAKVVESYYYLKDSSQVQEWAEKLSGTKVEPGLWYYHGRLLRSQGEYSSADIAFARDYSLYEKNHDYTGMSVSMYWRGYVAWETAKYKKALEYASASFDAASESDNNRREINALYLLFSIFQDLGYNDSAEQILELVKQRIAQDDASSQITFLVNESVLRMSQQRMSLARDSLQKSLGLIAGNESPRTFRTIYINLTETSLSLGDIQSATAHIAQAWKYVEPGGRVQTPLLYNQALVHMANGHYQLALEMLQLALEKEDISAVWRWQIYYEIGQAAEGLGNEHLQVSAYESAIQTLEDFRSTLLLDELKSAYLQKKRQPYEALFAFYAQKHDVKEALYVAEKAKARTFLDTYLHSEELQPEQELPGQVSMANMIEEAPVRINALNEILPAINESPVFSPDETVSILNNINGRDMLIYFEAQQGLWVFSITKGEIQLKQLHSNVAHVKRLVEGFLTNLNDHKAAKQLGKLLLPADILPVATSRLYIVPDSVLERVPFSALVFEDQRLIENYIISYAPSVNGLLAIENNEDDLEWQQAVVMGDPFDDLPSARLEAINIAKNLGVKPRLGDVATAENIYNSADTVLLHLSTHSGQKANGPWLGLADTKISVADILSQRVAPRLVTLASCASATREGRGLWSSLGAAFLAVGSKAVMASLWTVDDQNTRQFMYSFYAKDALNDPAKSLAETQREFIAKDRPVSEWSAFVLLGSNHTFNLLGE